MQFLMTKYDSKVCEQPYLLSLSFTNPQIPKRLLLSFGTSSITHPFHLAPPLSNSHHHSPPPNNCASYLYHTIVIPILHRFRYCCYLLLLQVLVFRRLPNIFSRAPCRFSQTTCTKSLRSPTRWPFFSYR